jgi:hypothetical protein
MYLVTEQRGGMGGLGQEEDLPPMAPQPAGSQTTISFPWYTGSGEGAAPRTGDETGLPVLPLLPPGGFKPWVSAFAARPLFETPQRTGTRDEPGGWMERYRLPILAAVGTLVLVTVLRGARR